ncbi:unnamed protein product [Brassicogethes aeneus]|uniref:3'-5' exonuclease domain-containing protein n=1 Tax=Brassicogethes aeneus TaxID=1431903 RepID=A0A9P0AQX0_BRAAE|nr:unnamed protein product [Brassicogethes aeneus]
MEKLYNTGDRLLLEVNESDVFEGNLYSVTDQRIDLYQVVKYSQNTNLNGMYSFFKDEITNIKRIYLRDCDFFNKLIDHINNLDISSLEPNFKDTVVLSYEDYSKIQMLKTNAIYIDRPDARYFKAMNEFKNTQHLAIAPVGLEDQRVNRALKFLVVCSFSQVYIFDFRNKKKTEFPKELRQMLESPFHKKIIYNGAFFDDFLIYNYNFQMCNVFDINIFDLCIFHLKNEESGWRTLEKCLETYLNLVPAVVRPEGEINRFEWSQISLPILYKIQLAELVVYLIPLEKVICREYNRLTKEFLTI